MDTYLATVMLFAGTYAPENWADCNGQLLSIQQYSALYSLLGTTYGGDGKTTFGLPDLRSRVPVGIQSTGTNIPNNTLTPYVLAQKGGVENVTLTAAQIAAHTHTATQATSTITGGSLTGVTANLAASTSTGGHNIPVAGEFLAVMEISGGETVSAYIAAANKGTTVNLGGLSISGGSFSGATVTNGAITVLPNTGNQAHENRQPFLAMRYIICTEGLYPPRPQ